MGVEFFVGKFSFLSEGVGFGYEDVFVYVFFVFEKEKSFRKGVLGFNEVKFIWDYKYFGMFTNGRVFVLLGE